MRPVISGELYHKAAWEPIWKLKDVSDRGPAKAIEALILIADSAEIAIVLRQLEQDLFLHIVSVLVFVNHDVTKIAG